MEPKCLKAVQFKGDNMSRIGKCVDCGTQCVADGSLAVLCPKCDAPTGRIEILGWRKLGADDDSVAIKVFADFDGATAVEQVAHEQSVSFDDSVQPPAGYTLGYVTSESTIADGQVLTSHDGRKFQISIREVA